MTEELTPIAKRFFESIIGDLKSHSLLHEEEPIIKGFYDVMIQGLKAKFRTHALCKGLLTKEKLILIIKQFSTDYRYELIPYDNIKEIIFTKVRYPIYLIMGLGFTVLGSIFIASSFLLMFSSPDYWISLLMFSILPIAGILSLLTFIKGDEVLFLDIPDEKLTLWHIKKPRTVTIFNGPQDNFEVQSSRGNIEDLYALLINNTECPVLKNEGFLYSTKISKNLQEKVHRRRSRR